MYCLDYAEGPQPDNLLSFIMHGPVFLGFTLRSLRIHSHLHRIRTVVKADSYVSSLRIPSESGL